MQRPWRTSASEAVPLGRVTKLPPTMLCLLAFFPPLQSPGSQSTCPFVRSQRRVPALSGDLAFAHRKLHVHTQYHFEWARYQRKIPNRLSTGHSIGGLLCVALLAVTAFVRFL